MSEIIALFNNPHPSLVPLYYCKEFQIHSLRQEPETFNLIRDVKCISGTNLILALHSEGELKIIRELITSYPNAFTKSDMEAVLKKTADLELFEFLFGKVDCKISQLTESCALNIDILKFLVSHVSSWRADLFPVFAEFVKPEGFDTRDLTTLIKIIGTNHTTLSCPRDVIKRAINLGNIDAIIILFQNFKFVDISLLLESLENESVFKAVFGCFKLGKLPNEVKVISALLEKIISSTRKPGIIKFIHDQEIYSRGIKISFAGLEWVVKESGSESELMELLLKCNFVRIGDYIRVL